MFTGAGGGVLAARLLGWETVQYVEWDAYCQEILRARIKDGFFHDAPIHDDVSTFDGTPFRGKVDVVSAGFPCFVAGTMVLAMQGFVPIEDIKVGDLVLTHLGRWRTVNTVMRREDMPLREIHAQGVPGVVCTETHPFHARERGRLWDNGSRKYQRTFTEPARTEAKDINSNHFIGQVLPPVQDDSRPEAFWRLVGRYLADGCRNFCNHAIVISGSSSEGDEMREIVEAAGYSPEIHDVESGKQAVFYNRDFFEFLEPFGRYSHGKRIPGWVLQLPVAKSKALLQGYLSGDGHRAVTGWEANTVGKALALGVALLAQRAFGVVASIRLVHTEPTVIIEGRTVNQRDYYAVRIPNRNRSAFVEGDYGWKKVKHNTPKGRGAVYNIAVDEDHTYVADGAVVLNCQPFSVAGKQGANNDERNRWPDTIRVIRDVRPKYAFLENVPGLLAGSHRYFGTILGDLATSGYHATWTCLPAAAVRAPHRRDRLWILATRAD